ncbi:unnamed protein product [Paramecium pentaurelia]|uniref:Potassium channel domain-containing protein n=1 Tax=Paramecium pentaurelia TaxID=43138 RepID=A0A8S1XJD7_9CILI|nr:unnamed protein product [Paramecium pentaurelia]
MFNIEFDQDVELRAMQNEDFEQQYLEHCLREYRKEPALTIPQISRTLSQKTIEAECLHKISETPFDENFILTQAQSSDIFGRKYLNQHERRSSIPNAGTSLMCSFYIRRFIEKISQSRKKLLSMNEIHFNLIEDKAADMQNLFNHQSECKRQGFTLGKMKTLLRKETVINNLSTQEEIKEQIRKIKKQFLNLITVIVNKIPIIQPESRLKMIWDFFASFFRIILVILIPLEIAFQPCILFTDFIVLTAMILLILQIDFLIRINTLSYRNGAAIQNRWELLIYQFKKEFFTDFSTSFLLIIFIIIPEMDNNLNLFLLLTLAQYKYIHETFAKSDQISYLTRPLRGIIGLVKFILTLLFILHLFSCIWFWFSKISLEDSWIKFNGLDLKSWELQYLEALYFAVVTMLTIGYGDNVPKNSIEKIITIIFILGACLWFSYSVNFIGGIINDITQNQVERNRKMRVINKYMDQRKIPFNLKHKVKEYLTFRWKEDDEVDLEIEQNLLEQLSDELKEELDKEAHKIFIKKSALLQHFSDELKDALSKSIKRKIIPPQNTFSIDFDDYQHLCFVEQGVLLYQHLDRKQRSKMNAPIKQGQFFCVQDFIIQSPQKDYFKSNGYVSLLILSKLDFMTTIKNYPEDFQKFCEMRELMTLSLNPPQLENGVFCPACLCFKHSMTKCPQIQYIPDREAILKKYLLPQIQDRKYYQRDFTKRFNSDQIISRSRLEKDLVQQFAQVFQSENHQLIQEQQKVQLIYEQDSISSSGDPSPCNKIQYDGGGFQAAVLKSKRLINDPPNHQSINSKLQDTKQSLHQAMQNRKQSILNLNIPSNIGKSPKNLLIPKVDIIKENEENEESSDSDDSNSSSNQNNEIKNQLSVTDFNENMMENVINLYHQLQRELELNENDQTIQKAYLQIEPIYWSFHQQNVSEFEIMTTYDYFFKSYNYNEIIKLAQKNTFAWQSQFINKLQKYMLYPFLFIQKYMSKKRNSKNTEKIKRDPSKRLNSRLNTLKNSLKLKKKQSVLIKPIKNLGQVAPEL